MNLKILIVEDDLKLRKIMKDFLSHENFLVIEASDGETALNLYLLEKPDLIILDLMIPLLNGFQVLKEIRNNNKNLPIIMLTARGNEEDILKGYSLKLNEYIIKPISMKVLIAKVKSFLRNDLNNQEIKFKNIILNKEKRNLLLNDKAIELSQKEFEILNLFITNKNQVLTREQIITSLWGYDYCGDTRAVDSQIKRLRKKLNGKYIKTVRGLGYKLEEE